MQANRAYKLHTSLGIGWARKFDPAFLALRNFSKGVGPVINDVRPARPVLFVVVALG